MLPDGPCCADCPHAREGAKFIGPDGSGASGILLVGDSPWIDEQRAGRVFAGAAGRMLDRMLKLMPGGGLERQDLTVWNTIQCPPEHLRWMDFPGRYPEAATAIEHCRPHLDEIIATRKPRVIVPMGNVALRRVCGRSGIEAVAGYVMDTPYGIPAVPTYHPSYIMQGKQALIPVVLWAFDRAQQIADGRYEPSSYDLLEDPEIPNAWGYLNGNPSDTLFIDIETPESANLDEEELESEGVSFNIIRCGFSTKQGTAISFPWCEPYIELFKEAVRRAKVIVEWADNRFDTRRLAAAGVDFTGKQIISGMWAWHWLQSDLRKGLNLVAPFYYAGRPWKHLSAALPAYYNAMDNAVGLDCYIGIRDALIAQKRWEPFLRHCVGMVPILESMGRAGLKIDTAYRDEFMASIAAEREEIYNRIQTQVPDSVRPAKYWKKGPKDDLPTEPSDKEGYAVMRRESFNPRAWPQVQDLAKALAIKLPKKEGSDDPEDTSTDEKALKRAAKTKKGHVFLDILEYRKRDKLITSYTWPLDDEGRVHYQFGFHPSTWRKSCRSVNIQTIPKRSDLAKKFRRMIVASPGHILVEGDSSAIEAVLVGWLAGSERYMRLAKAGVHGWLTSALHGIPIPLSLDDTALAQACRAAKKHWPEDYEKCKRVTHLTGYLGTPRRIFEEYPDDFASESDARKLQQFLLSTEIGDDIKAWQKATVERAHAQRYLDTPFGLRHRFYSLYQWNTRRQAWEFGDDAKRAVAFCPQSIASFIQSEVVLRLAAEGWLPYMRAIIHDSLILEVPEDLAPRAAAALYQALTAPISVLGDLVIGAEVTMGRNLASSKADNPDGMCAYEPVVASPVVVV